MRIGERNKQLAKEQLELALRHFERVQAAWDHPTNWEVLATFGFYCLEAAIVAAAIYLNWSFKRTHPGKAEIADRLYEEKGFPDISGLLWDMNEARKSIAYGDIDFPSLNAEDVAIEIEKYIQRVKKLIEE